MSSRGAVLLTCTLLAGLSWTGDAGAQSFPRRQEPAVWMGLMTDTQLVGAWSLFADTHYNSRAFVVLRGGLTYRTEAGPSFTGGYAQLWTDPGNGTLSRSESRPWAQVFLPFGFADDWTLSQRFRGELRLQEQIAGGEVTSGIWATPRFRSQTGVSYWFADYGAMRWFVQAAVELLVNGGPNAGPNYLDQTRWSAMVGYRKKPVTVRVGYMNRFVPTKLGASPLHEHNAVFWVSLKGRRKDEPTAEPAVELPEGGNP